MDNNGTKSLSLGTFSRKVILHGVETETLIKTLRDVEQKSMPQRLETTGQEGSCESHKSDGVDDSVAASREGWEVYYDNDDFALTSRGWWLREEGGGWLLRVPLIIPGGPQGLFTEITVPGDILEWVGLEQHAELVRSGKNNNIERLLGNVGVRPYARFRCVRRSTGRAPRNDSASMSKMDVQVTVDTVHFDMKYAENAALCDTIFAYGSEAFRASVAEFVISLDDTSSDEITRQYQMQQMLFSTLRSLGLERWEVPVGLCPKLMSYMWALRPAHLRQITRAGVVPSWTPPGMTGPPPVPPVPGASKAAAEADTDLVE